MVERVLAYISEKKIYETEDLYRNTVNNMDFHYKTNFMGKLMIKFFFKFKKCYFWPIFGPFPIFLGAKNVFLKNLACTTW